MSDTTLTPSARPSADSLPTGATTAAPSTGMGELAKPSLSTSSLFVVIPLRKGSQGCPGKSLRPFNSSTLLEHAVHDAIQIGPTHIIVTTDYGLDEVPVSVRPYHVSRPAHLCHPDTPMTLVLKHVAQSMFPMDTILLMQPNCYHPDRLRLARRVLNERVAGTSVRYPDFWHPAYAIGSRSRRPKTRQSLEPAYRPDGLLYRVPVAHLLLLDPFDGDYVPVHGTVNVDTEADWEELNERYGVRNL